MIMTLAEAITVLNQRRHRGAEWSVYSMAPQREFAVGYSVGQPAVELTPFEAIAVAEKYTRLPPEIGWTELEPLLAAW
jgi:hypothetical protein